VESDIYIVAIEFLREDEGLSEVWQVVISVREFRGGCEFFSV
jgi:hypothetical protein